MRVRGMAILKSNPSLTARAKVERMQDAVGAIQEHEAETLAVLAKTATVGRLRLTKEASARPEAARRTVGISKSHETNRKP
jgi:hypothetical protein